jgi:hypothetical protein
MPFHAVKLTKRTLDVVKVEVLDLIRPGAFTVTLSGEPGLAEVTLVDMVIDAAEKVTVALEEV